MEGAGGRARILGLDIAHQQVAAPVLLEILVRDAHGLQDGVKLQLRLTQAQTEDAGVRLHVDAERRTGPGPHVDMRLENAVLLHTRVDAGLQAHLVPDRVLVAVVDERAAVGQIRHVGYRRLAPFDFGSRAFVVEHPIAFHAPVERVAAHDGLLLVLDGELVGARPTHVLERQPMTLVLDRVSALHGLENVLLHGFPRGDSVVESTVPDRGRFYGKIETACDCRGFRCRGLGGARSKDVGHGFFGHGSSLQSSCFATPGG